jgi:hypothetical protein
MRAAISGSAVSKSRAQREVFIVGFVCGFTLVCPVRISLEKINRREIIHFEEGYVNFTLFPLLMHHQR